MKLVSCTSRINLSLDLMLGTIRSPGSNQHLSYRLENYKFLSNPDCLNSRSGVYRVPECARCGIEAAWQSTAPVKEWQSSPSTRTISSPNNRRTSLRLQTSECRCGQQYSGSSEGSIRLGEASREC